MKLSLFCCCLLAVLLSFSAKAQTTGTEQAARLKAATELLAASNIESQMSTMYANMITASSAQVPEDKKAKFKEIMLDFLNKYMGFASIQQDMAKIYAEEFTESELKEITKFYLSPAGKKASLKTALLQQKGIAIAQQKMQAHLPELQQSIQAQLGK